jgi:hypothetical protein
MADLEHLARYWARQALWTRLETFLYGQVSCSGWRTRSDAQEHLAQIATLVGEPAIRAAWRDVEDEARRDMGEVTWRVWTSGSPAEQAQVADETHQAWDYLNGKVADVATQAPGGRAPAGRTRAGITSTARATCGAGRTLPGPGRTGGSSCR